MFDDVGSRSPFDKTGEFVILFKNFLTIVLLPECVSPIIEIT
jgi:hypothetical protein